MQSLTYLLTYDKKVKRIFNEYIQVFKKSSLYTGILKITERWNFDAEKYKERGEIEWFSKIEFFVCNKLFDKLSLSLCKLFYVICRSVEP
jgi:hypothetical protein